MNKEKTNKKKIKINKEKIKKISITLLHVTCYVLSGLFLLILLIGFLGGACEQKQDTPNTKQTNINYVNDIKNNDNDYLIRFDKNTEDQRIIYMYQEKNASYDSFKNAFNYLKPVVNSSKKSDDYINIYYYQDGYGLGFDINVTYIESVAFLQTTDKAKINLQYTDNVGVFHTIEKVFYKNTGTNTNIWLFVYGDNYSIYNENFLNVYHVGAYSLNGGLTTTDYTYYLPPYLPLDKHTKTFKQYIGFTYHNLRYNTIYYKYHEYLQFIGDYSTITYKPVLSGDGNSYIFEMYDSRLGFPFNLEIPYISFTCFGVGGLEFLNNFFTPLLNPYVNGNYYLDLSFFTMAQYSTYKKDGSMQGGDQYYEFKFPFMSNNLGFSGVRLHTETGNTTGDYFILIDYITNVDTYVNVYKSKRLNENSFENEKLDYIDSVKNEYLSIQLYDCPLTKDLYNAISRIFTADNMNGYRPSDGSSGVLIGGTDVFSLIAGGFGAIASLFTIQLLPGLAIGTLFLIPLMVLIILAVINLFKR